MKLLVALALVIVNFFVVVSAQELFPNKPVRLIVPTTAGGGSDVAARALAEGLRLELGQPVIIENRVGASGAIAMELVAKSPPDGYTLIWGASSTFIAGPVLSKNLPYDPQKDFPPIALASRVPFIFVTSTAFPAKSLSDVLAAAKQRPGAVSFGTTGPATSYEISALVLEALAGVKFNHVPFSGMAPLINSMSGGHVDVAVAVADASVVQQPKIRVLAALGKKRISTLPDVPSAAELGFPDFDTPGWTAVFAPANLPPTIRTRLENAVLKALSTKEVQTRMDGAGFFVDAADGAQLRRRVTAEIDSAREAIRKAGAAAPR